MLTVHDAAVKQQEAGGAYALCYYAHVRRDRLSASASVPPCLRACVPACLCARAPSLFAQQRKKSW